MRRLYITQPLIFRLDDLYKQYLDTASLSKKVFRTSLQTSLLKKSYELASGSQFYTIILMLQTDNLVGLIVFDKTNQHTALFDRYNVELASTVLEKAQVENITNTYCVANDLEFE